MNHVDFLKINAKRSEVEIFETLEFWHDKVEIITVVIRTSANNESISKSMESLLKFFQLKITFITYLKPELFGYGQYFLEYLYSLGNKRQAR